MKFTLNILSGQANSEFLPVSFIKLRKTIFLLHKVTSNFSTLKLVLSFPPSNKRIKVTRDYFSTLHANSFYLNVEYFRVPKLILFLKDIVIADLAF